MQKRIGFAGLGLMGVRMAENILKKGFPLTVWNRTASKADALWRRPRWRPPRSTWPSAPTWWWPASPIPRRSRSSFGPQGLIGGVRPGFR